METNNNYFITNMVEKIENGESTLFLNQSELQKIKSILNKKKIKYEILYPYVEAEKVIIYQDIKPEITLLEIKCKHVLKHSDILGSLFGYNINPNSYGDIVIIDNKYYLIILNKLLKFFLTQFRIIGKFNIEINEVNLDLISNYKVQYDSLKLLCSSLRIDNVVSSVTDLSRSSVDEMFSAGNILLNYEFVKKFKVLEEGDILSIRKYGKYKLNCIMGKNKKGKIIIEVLKYK